MRLLGKDMSPAYNGIVLCRCKVVGHDFGAALAWGLAIALPERVEKLCVISVGHLGRSPCIVCAVAVACSS